MTVLGANLGVLIASVLVGEVVMRVATDGEASLADRIARISVLDGAAVPDRDAVVGGNGGGLRPTVGQPEVSEGRVLLFGGSTVFGREVGDADTLPSRLQALLNERGLRVAVDNYGAEGAGGAYAVEWLRSLPTDAEPRRGDLVVIYLGVNDAGLTFALRSPIDRVAGRSPAIGDSLSWLGERSVVAARLMSLVGKGAITVSPREVARLRDALAEAQSWVDARGARLLLVLQPNLFTRADPNEYERALGDLYGEGLRRAVLEAYGLIEPVVRTAERSVVATDAMDGLMPSPYLDWMHVTAQGNARVAEILAPAVVDMLADG